MPFVLKKFISQFLMPVPFVTVLFLAGWGVARFSRLKRLGKVMQGTALALFLAFGYGLGADRYLYRIERTYPAVELNEAEAGRLRGAMIVVLGQGFAENSDIPLRYRTGAVFQARLLEGTRLFQSIPEARMIVSVAGDEAEAPKQAYLDDHARAYGLARDRIHLISTARDTAEEARLALDAMLTHVIVVVTSASHIPRAVILFQNELLRRGHACRVAPGGKTIPDTGTDDTTLTLIPAPCDYQMPGKPPLRFRIWQLPLPSTQGLQNAEIMLHEWLGLIAGLLRAPSARNDESKRGEVARGGGGLLRARSARNDEGKKGSGRGETDRAFRARRESKKAGTAAASSF